MTHDAITERYLDLNPYTSDVDYEDHMTLLNAITSRCLEPEGSFDTTLLDSIIEELK